MANRESDTPDTKTASAAIDQLLADSPWIESAPGSQLEMRETSSGKIPGRTVDIRQIRESSGLPVRNIVQIFRRYRDGQYIENQVAWHPDSQKVQGDIVIGVTVLKSLIEA